MVRRDGTLILCYHRIAEGVEDPFYLCVSPGNFAAHLEELSRAREPSTLADVSVPSPRPRVVVTLDDGYRDNLTNALPIAESKGIPITVFVTSGILRNRNGFWWDRLGTLLRSRPPHVREIDLPAGGRNVRLPLGSSGIRADLDSVRRHLLPLQVTEIERVLDAVSEKWQVGSAPPPDAETLTPGDLLQLAASGTVMIGAHTVDHVRLRDRPAREQQDTISGSKRELEQSIGRVVSHFAYPFGGREHFDDRSVDAVRSAAFETACTTIPGTARSSTDPYRLPRRLVMDWGRLRFRAQMQRWKLGLATLTPHHGTKADSERGAEPRLAPSARQHARCDRCSSYLAWPSRASRIIRRASFRRVLASGTRRGRGRISVAEAPAARRYRRTSPQATERTSLTIPVGICASTENHRSFLQGPVSVTTTHVPSGGGDTGHTGPAVSLTAAVVLADK